MVLNDLNKILQIYCFCLSLTHLKGALALRSWFLKVTDVRGAPSSTATFTAFAMSPKSSSIWSLTSYLHCPSIAAASAGVKLASTKLPITNSLKPCTIFNVLCLLWNKTARGLRTGALWEIFLACCKIGTNTIEFSSKGRKGGFI